MRNTVLIPALLALSVGLAACSHQPNVNLENAKTNFSALQTNPEATKVAGAGSAAAHMVMAMVLPEPAGPVIVVSGPRAPSVMSLSICGRRTAQAGGLGTVIFDIRTGSSAPATWPLGRAARESELDDIGVLPDPADSVAAPVSWPQSPLPCPMD
jgi:hypothetical protein